MDAHGQVRDLLGLPLGPTETNEVVCVDENLCCRRIGFGDFDIEVCHCKSAGRSVIVKDLERQVAGLRIDQEIMSVDEDVLAGLDESLFSTRIGDVIESSTRRAMCP